MTHTKGCPCVTIAFLLALHRSAWRCSDLCTSIQHGIPWSVSPSLAATHSTDLSRLGAGQAFRDASDFMTDQAAESRGDALCRILILAVS